MQVIAVMTPALNLPDWVDSFLAILFIAGFPISMLVAWAFEITPTGIARTEAVDIDASIREATGRKLDISLLVGLLLVAGLIVFDRFMPESNRIVTAETPNTEQSLTEQTILPTRIAVLPFSDISRNQDQQYFSDGISEEILNVSMVCRLSDEHLPFRSAPKTKTSNRSVNSYKPRTFWTVPSERTRMWYVFRCP